MLDETSVLSDVVKQYLTITRPILSIYGVSRDIDWVKKKGVLKCLFPNKRDIKISHITYRREILFLLKDWMQT